MSRLLEPLGRAALDLAARSVDPEALALDEAVERLEPVEAAQGLADEGAERPQIWFDRYGDSRANDGRSDVLRLPDPPDGDEAVAEGGGVPRQRRVARHLDQARRDAVDGVVPAARGGTGRHP